MATRTSPPAGFYDTNVVAAADATIDAATRGGRRN
jgi:hypothetical protein